MILQLLAMAFRPGILSFRVTVPPRLPGSVTLFRWSHSFSIAVEPMGSRKKVHFLLPTGSCEQLRKHRNHPLLPYLCQFLFTKFSSNFDVSNFADYILDWIVEPSFGRYVNDHRAVPVGSGASRWPEAPADQIVFLPPAALSFVRLLTVLGCVENLCKAFVHVRKGIETRNATLIDFQRRSVLAPRCAV
jgi:hypothetical protein